jgi:glycosyltransferase involved in cell wall biosynthesis
VSPLNEPALSFRRLTVMKVLLISGSYPPETCGIGDYTVRLRESLNALGIESELLRSVEWRVSQLFHIRSAVRASKADVVHLQYPSEKYSNSISPQLLSLTTPLVVTLHEFSHARLPRKIASLPFFLSASHLILTSEQERSFVAARWPWIRRKSTVIPIGSNVPLGPFNSRRDPRRLVYFGLLSPRKGLESVLEFARIVRSRNLDLQVEIVGTAAPRFRAYAQELMNRSEDLRIIWTLNKTLPEVGNVLNSASLAYLPFPDGASERRGSLKAALAAGLVCLTTEGKNTPEDMKAVVLLTSGPQDAVLKAQEAAQNEQKWQRLSAAARHYADGFAWSRIAELHAELYGKLCERRW